MQEGDLLCRHESTRMAFAELQDGSLTLFVDGFEYTSGVGGQTPRADLLRCLTQQSRLTQVLCWYRVCLHAPGAVCIRLAGCSV